MLSFWGQPFWLYSAIARYITLYNYDSIQLSISPLSLPFWEERDSPFYTPLYLIPSSPFPVPTGPPQGLVVASRNTTSIAVTWRDPAPDRINDRDGVTGFVIRRNRQRVATVTNRTYTFTGLRPATNYTFEVLAVNDQGRAPKKHAARLTTSTTGMQAPVQS